MFNFFDSIFFQDSFLFLFFLITFIYYVFASYQDFKEKEVFNFTNFSYLFISIFLILIYSLMNNSIEIFYVGFIGIIVGFVIGSILFFLGIWGGGDAKFLIPFGGTFAILSIYSNSLYSSTSSLLSYFDIDSSITFTILYQIITILAYIFIIFLTLIIMYILYTSIKNLKLQKFKQTLNRRILLISNFYLILFILFAISSLISILPKEIRLISLLICVLLLFVLPSSTFLNFSNIQKISVKKLLDLLEKDSNTDFYEFSENKKNTFLNTFYNNPESVSLKLLKNKDKNAKITVLELLPILPIFFIYLIISLLLLIVSFKELSLRILLHFFEFMLLSFFVGGMYVLGLVLFNSFRYYKLIIHSLPKYRLYLYVFLVIFLPVLYIYFLNSFNTYSVLLIQIILLLLVITISLVLYETTKIIEKEIFVKKVSIKDITLGDWIVEDVTVEGKVILEKEAFKLGVDEHQLNVLQNLFDEKKISSLKVKSGIAFVPHLFLAFLILIILNIIF